MAVLKHQVHVKDPALDSEPALSQLMAPTLVHAYRWKNYIQSDITYLTVADA